MDSGGADSVHYNVYAAQLEGSSTAEYRKVNDKSITRCKYWKMQVLGQGKFEGALCIFDEYFLNYPLNF